MKRLTRIDIIKETVDFYSQDPVNRRSIDEEEPEMCLYNSSNGKQCAFARYVEEPEDCIERKNASDLLEKKVITLKKGVRHLKEDLYFWNNLQYLHDDEENWTKTGLSTEGEGEVNRLLEKYKE